MYEASESTWIQRTQLRPTQSGHLAKVCTSSSGESTGARERPTAVFLCQRALATPCAKPCF
ncbi:hypothetical protein Pcac1_g12465 [Phytophthora cactorum]|nr:hypothetical protein Pcac1_g12465 [Phytophthora cactorum]